MNKRVLTVKLIRRCAFGNSVRVDWNIQLEVIEEPVYARDCTYTGIHLTDHRVPL